MAYTGDDPLSMWYALYQWTSSTHPLLVQPLLERALDLLQSDPSYPSNAQYVGLWLAYARLCPDPLPFYTDMYTQGVGSSLTVLYLDWADALESGEREDEADAVYMKGLLQHAQPLADLIARYDAFKKRSAARRKQPPAPSAEARKRSAAEVAVTEEGAKAVKQAKTVTAPPAAAPQADRSALSAQSYPLRRTVRGDERGLTLRFLCVSAMCLATTRVCCCWTAASRSSNSTARDIGAQRIPHPHPQPQSRG